MSKLWKSKLWKLHKQTAVPCSKSSKFWQARGFRVDVIMTDYTHLIRWSQLAVYKNKSVNINSRKIWSYKLSCRNQPLANCIAANSGRQFSCQSILASYRINSKFASRAAKFQHDVKYSDPPDLQTFSYGNIPSNVYAAFVYKAHLKFNMQWKIRGAKMNF